MNILFLSRDYPPNLVGGVGIYTLEMSRLMAKEGHNVFVITSAMEFESEYIDKGVRVFRVKHNRFKICDPIRDKIREFLERLEYSYAVSRKIKEVVHRFNIDIIESCEARAEGFWYFLFNRNIPLVIKLHTPESVVFKLDNIPRSRDLKLIEFLEHWWIERADKVIGLTDAVISLTEKHFKLTKNHLPKVPNPIEIDCFRPLRNIDILNTNTVLYVGRLEFRKGVHILTKAIPYVLKKIPDAKFVFIGADCGMKPYILNKIKEFDCKRNIELIDDIYRENLIRYYQSASVCVIPSLWENHPYVCLEAMACGKPVIASRVAGLKEIISNGNGVLTRPGSFQELASKIIDILKSKDVQEEIGNNARRSIEENYSPSTVLKKTLDVYQGLTENK